MRKFIWTRRYAFHLWWISGIPYSECLDVFAEAAFEEHGLLESPIEAAEIDSDQFGDCDEGCDCCSSEEEGGK